MKSFSTFRSMLLLRPGYFLLSICFFLSTSDLQGQLSRMVWEAGLYAINLPAPYSGIVMAETSTGVPPKNWTYYANHKPGNSPGCTSNGNVPGASATLCTCNLPNTDQNVLAFNTNDPLNGVNAWDLILISRSMLGISPLTGFKLLAGDANFSGTVTTFDNVELRKLILGTYTHLPRANSWRFFDKTLATSIHNNSNPFPLLGAALTVSTITPPNTFNQFTEGEFATFQLPAGASDHIAELIAVKVGDVSGDATPDNYQGGSEERGLPQGWLGQTALKGRKNEAVEITLAAAEGLPLAALQLSLGFDPELLAISEVVWELPHDETSTIDKGWNLPSGGELRLLWTNPFEGTDLKRGMPICRIRARLLKDLPAPLAVFSPLKNEVGCSAFSATGIEKRIGLQVMDRTEIAAGPAEDPTFAPLSVYPNPSSGHFRIEVQVAEPGEAVLWINNLNGAVIHRAALTLQGGHQILSSRQLPTLPAGQYEIRLATRQTVYTARFIKQ